MSVRETGARLAIAVARAIERTERAARETLAIALYEADGPNGHDRDRSKFAKLCLEDRELFREGAEKIMRGEEFFPEPD